MKKIMIAVAIVCAAAMSQASTIKWSSKATSGSGGSLYAPDGTTELTAWAAKTGYSITDAILVNTADLTQADLLKGLRDKTYTFGNSKLDSTSVGDKGIVAKTTGELDSLAGKAIDVYYAVFATDKDGNTSVLISTIRDGIVVPAASGASVAASWGSAGHTFSAVNNGTATFGNAGWYTVAASSVPEPTSGLLLLLGVAGLALRRRRA